MIDLSRRVAASSLALAGLAAAVAGAVDLVLLARAGVPAGVVACGAAAAAGLGAGAGLLAGAPWALCAHVAAGARARGRRWWPAPLVLAALGCALLIPAAVPTARAHVRLAIELVWAAGVLACALVDGGGGRRLRVAAGVGAAGLAIAECVPPRAFYPELHDLVAAAALACGFVALQPWRARLAAIAPRRLAAAALVVAVASTGVVLAAERLAPGWRAAAQRGASWSPRLLRHGRTLVDYDRDGFSPILWGGDCDDLDAERSPLARERAGAPDQNCNGSELPVAPADDERGLAPPAGAADLEAPAELVVLVTVDTWRADMLRPERMPRLAALAAEGVVLERVYAGGARTERALPWIWRVPGGVDLARRLGDAHVRRHAVVTLPGGGWARLLAPFEDAVVVAGDAAEVTDAALASFARLPRTPALLWVHYMDPHEHDGANYGERVAGVDRELDRLVQVLRADPRWPHTVLIVTADHGEGLGEHGVPWHSVGTWEAVVRVPVLLIAPGLAPARASQLASQLDVLPTLLGAFALVETTPGAEALGRSWLRLRAAPLAPLHQSIVIRSDREVSGREARAPIVAIVEEEWKLVVGLEDGLVELYDVIEDPEEMKDLALERPEVVARMRRRLAVYMDINPGL